MKFSDTPEPVSRIQADALSAEIFADRQSMGRAAARHVAGALAELQQRQEEVRIVVGSAPSQDEFFQHLVSSPCREAVDWSKVVVFHMDEYLGLPADHPQSFRRYQQEHFVSKIPLKAFHGIRGEATDPEEECRRISELLAEKPIDLVCLGIGENGHLAFNDPPVADFDDPHWAKIVELDAACRQQQVNDGCFPDIGSVPTRAITLTLRVFREAGRLSGVVPAKTKAPAVAATLEGPVTSDCPATLCRRHPNARLFLDEDAASELTKA